MQLEHVRPGVVASRVELARDTRARWRWSSATTMSSLRSRGRRAAPPQVRRSSRCRGPASRRHRRAHPFRECRGGRGSLHAVRHADDVHTALLGDVADSGDPRIAVVLRRRRRSRRPRLPFGGGRRLEQALYGRVVGVGVRWTTLVSGGFEVGEARSQPLKGRADLSPAALAYRRPDSKGLGTCTWCRARRIITSGLVCTSAVVRRAMTVTGWA